MNVPASTIGRRANAPTRDDAFANPDGSTLDDGGCLK